MWIAFMSRLPGRNTWYQYLVPGTWCLAFCMTTGTRANECVQQRLEWSSIILILVLSWEQSLSKTVLINVYIEYRFFYFYSLVTRIRYSNKSLCLFYEMVPATSTRYQVLVHLLSRRDTSVLSCVLLILFVGIAMYYCSCDNTTCWMTLQLMKQSCSYMFILPCPTRKDRRLEAYMRFNQSLTSI